jgi:hypothetical protein
MAYHNKSKKTYGYKQPIQSKVEAVTHTPTEEQQDVINTVCSGQNVVVKAFAGAAKTSTCVMVAKAYPVSSLYVAFNKSIAEEAKSKFPPNVECRTIHSLAYGAMVDGSVRKRLGSFFDRKDIIHLFFEKGLDTNDYDDDAIIVDEALELVTLFCQSDKFSIGDFTTSLPNIDDYNPISSRLAWDFWEALSEKDSTIKITHDVYLKWFQLSKPILAYNLIYVDEFQDTSPVIADIVLNQKSQLVLVGDSYQSIYAWRGAINALEQVPSTFTLKYLSTSFRFTQEIADMANKLTSIVGNTVPIKGKASFDKTNLPITPDDWTKATLVRTNSMLLETLIVAESLDKKVYVIADLKDLWSKMYHINGLAFNNDIRYPDKELKQFTTYKELEETAKNVPELRKLIKLTAYLTKGGLTTNIKKIQSILVDEEHKDEADFTLVTSHKSKGLEWSEVTLAEDMFIPREEESPFETLMNNQTLNLLYVAITRGKYVVNIPWIIQDIIDNYELYQEEYITYYQ